MDRADLDKMSELSPFELKDTLVTLASRHSERLMLNAGRGNPNFLSTVPRHGFFQLGLFAMSEAERYCGDMREGVGGLPQPEGIAARFETFAQARQETPGVAFLSSALSYVREQLGFSDRDFLQELVEGVLGCNYPSPVRMLAHTEEIVRHYLRKEMTGGPVLAGRIDLFAVEGATALRSRSECRSSPPISRSRNSAIIAWSNWLSRPIPKRVSNIPIASSINFSIRRSKHSFWSILAIPHPSRSTRQDSPRFRTSSLWIGGI